MKRLFFLMLTFCSFGAFAQDTTTVSTTVSDPDGIVVSTKFELLSGPTGSVIATPNPSPTNVKTVISFTQVGEYIFQLSATDNDGGISRRQFKITTFQNQLPVIQFIEDKKIKLK